MKKTTFKVEGKTQFTISDLPKRITSEEGTQSPEVQEKNENFGVNM